jgi:hypothetical protein
MALETTVGLKQALDKIEGNTNILQTKKDSLATAISSKGVLTQSTDNLDVMNTNIENISTKPKIKEGMYGVAQDIDGNIYSVSDIEDIRKYYEIRKDFQSIWEEVIPNIKWMEIDSQNNIYVGVNNVELRKINPEGHTIWQREISFNIYDMFIDVKDNIYIHYKSITDSTMGGLLKMDIEGNEVWNINEIYHDSPNYYKIGADKDCNLIQLEKVSESDVLVRKFDSNLETELFNTLIPEETTGRLSLAILDNNEILVGGINLFKIDLNGNYKNLTSGVSGLSQLNINDIKINNENYIYLLESNSIYKLKIEGDTVQIIDKEKAGTYNFKKIVIDIDDYKYDIREGGTWRDLYKYGGKGGYSYSLSNGWIEDVRSTNDGYFYVVDGQYYPLNSKYVTKIVKYKDNYTIEKAVKFLDY